MSDMQITDWFTLVPSLPRDKRRTYIELPVFNYDSLTWDGASRIITQFNYSADKNFTIIRLPTQPVGCNFLLCIRYRVGNTVYRYKLWNHDLAILSDVNLYNGEIIKKNFVLEVWNTTETSVSISAVMQLMSSVLISPTDLRDISMVSLATGTEFYPVEITPTAFPTDGLVFNFDETGIAHTGDGTPVTAWVDTVAAYELQGGTSDPTYVASDANCANKAVVEFAEPNVLTCAVGPIPTNLEAIIFSTLTVPGVGLTRAFAQSYLGDILQWNNGAGKLTVYMQNDVQTDWDYTAYYPVGQYGIFIMSRSAAGTYKTMSFGAYTGYNGAEGTNTGAVANSLLTLGKLTHPATTSHPGVATCLNCRIARWLGYNVADADLETARQTLMKHLKETYFVGLEIPLDFTSDNPWLDNV